MNKSGGPTPVGSPRGNTGRKLPDVPARGSKSVVTNAPEVRTDDSHGLPGLRAGSPNLAYERGEPGHPWDEGEFKPLNITRIALHEMEVPVYHHAYVVDPQVAGTTGAGGAAIHSPSQPNEADESDEVDLSDFLSGLTKQALSPAASSPLGDDTRVWRHTTRQSDVRQRWANKPPAKELNLKKLPLRSGAMPATHDSPRQTFIPLSPRGASSPRSPARQFGQERKGPVSQAVPPSQASARKKDETVAEKGEVFVAKQSKPTRPGLTKPGTASFAAIREEKAQRQRSAYQVSLQNLEAELDSVFDELLSLTSSTDDVSTESRQGKSENA